MSDEFTKEQMESAHIAGQEAARTYPLHISAQKYVDDIIAEIIKPKWKPAEQVVIQMCYENNPELTAPRNRHLFFGNPNDGMRPLTTKEAGPECMQHLVGVLENIKFQTAMYGNAELAHNESKDALTKHKELIK